MPIWRVTRRGFREGVPLADGGKKRLAIVSSGGDGCGIAHYSRILCKNLLEYYDVSIIPVDSFLINNSGERFRKAARAHIDEIADQIRNFDCVNIQFEIGIFGCNVKEAYRNLERLMISAPNIVVTLHSIEYQSAALITDLARSVMSVSVKPLQNRRALGNHAKLYEKVATRCRQLAAHKNVWVKVHTRRDQRVMHEMLGCPNVADGPLTYMNPEERRAAMTNVNRQAMLDRYALPLDAKVMAGFGFLSRYKAFDHLINALELLPPEWYLVLAGSQHPQTVRRWQQVDPYIGALIKQIDQVDKARGEQGLRLRDRIRFGGNVDDDEFTFLLRNADASVLPYLEVGQSFSGVLANAVEVGARLFCSNNRFFDEARKYYGEVFGRFDIGNFVEVAQRVRFDTRSYEEQRERAYAKYNILNTAKLYRSLFEGNYGR